MWVGDGESLRAAGMVTRTANDTTLAENRVLGTQVTGQKILAKTRVQAITSGWLSTHHSQTQAGTPARRS